MTFILAETGNILRHYGMITPYCSVDVVSIDGWTEDVYNPEDEATTQDYQNALEQMGVNFDADH